MFFDCAIFLDTEDAGVYWLVDIVGAEMAFGDELLPETNSVIDIDSGSVEQAVFLNVIPTYFV